MKPRVLFLFVLGVVIGVLAGRHFTMPAMPPAAVAPAGSTQPRLFQCPMHPWIKSEHEGKCTICGMDLVRAGDVGLAMDNGRQIVQLPATSITAIGVQTSPVVRAKVKRTLGVSGLLESSSAQDWHPPRSVMIMAAGEMTKVYASRVGAFVKTGEPLAALNSPEIFSARQNFWELSHNNAPEADQMAAREKLSHLGLSNAQIDALSHADHVEVETEILAPCNGILSDVQATVGRHVDPGAMAFSIRDLNVLRFIFNVTEENLAWLKVGQNVAITLPARPGKTCTYPITYIDPNIDTNTRVARVEVKIPNDMGELVDNISAIGTVAMLTEEVLTAPRNAILNTDMHCTAYVDLGGGRYEQRHVVTGRFGSDAVEIMSGLAEGERVVTTAALLIDAQAQLEREADVGAHSK